MDWKLTTPMVYAFARPQSFRFLSMWPDIPDEETFYARVKETFEIIQHHLGIFKRLRHTMNRRVHARAETNGEHFEHLCASGLRTLSSLVQRLTMSIMCDMTYMGNWNRVHLLATLL